MSDDNPGRGIMAECRDIEAKLSAVIHEIAEQPDLGLRFEAAADLVKGLIDDASLEGIGDAVHWAEQLMLGNQSPCYVGCFDGHGHMAPEDLAYEDAAVERTCLAIALIKQKAIRKWLLKSLVACARHDVKAENWQGQIEWFVRQAQGHVDWAETDMGNVNFKVEMRPAGESASPSSGDEVVH
ncbi:MULTISPECIES: hypothetical protein [unclassified Brevundimonas]|uniref:hypothetical protein n=1 Tax=Brevundimonas TaxID=41275 RepID=UPI0022365387|nr:MULTISPECIES: hypothetical protein [unclassified Brevundimonas]MCW0047276.1 hypothetical protein [Brevundimonas sp. BT-123]